MPVIYWRCLYDDVVYWQTCMICCRNVTCDMSPGWAVQDWNHASAEQTASLQFGVGQSVCHSEFVQLSYNSPGWNVLHNLNLTKNKTSNFSADADSFHILIQAFQEFKVKDNITLLKRNPTLDLFHKTTGLFQISQDVPILCLTSSKHSL